MSGLAQPDKWMRRRLRFDVETNPVKSEVTLPDDAEVSFVPMDAVGEYGGLRLDETKQLGDVYNGYTYFRDGDLCIAKITPCFENGKGALTDELKNGVGFGTTELHVVRPGATVDRKFLFYVSIAHDFRSIGAAEMLGAGGQKRVPERFIKDWRAPLPSLDTQKRIAAFLDQKTAQIDALIAKKQALLERLAEKRQAIITQAVTKGLNFTAPMKDSGIDWLGEMPAHWKRRRLRFLLNGDTRNGLYKPKDQFYDGGIPFVQMGEAFRDVYFEGGTKDRVLSEPTEVACWGLERGDFLIARRSIVFDGSGKSVLIGSLEEPHLFESSMIRIRLINPKLAEFLGFYFRSSLCRALFLAITKQVTISGIDSQQLKNIPVLIPPREEFLFIVSYLSRVMSQLNHVKTGVEGTVSKLIEYRAALITDAVTGRIVGLR